MRVAIVIGWKTTLDEAKRLILRLIPGEFEICITDYDDCIIGAIALDMGVDGIDRISSRIDLTGIYADLCANASILGFNISNLIIAEAQIYEDDL